MSFLATRGAAGSGPCSPVATAPVIAISAESDFAKRLQFSNSTTVILSLTQSIRLSVGLRFNSSFSCTILQPADGLTTANILFNGFAAPVLSIIGAGNMLFRGVGVQNEVTPANVKGCALPVGGEAICPAIYFFQAHNIQYTRAFVYGRIGVFQSVFITLDSLEVTMAGNPNNVAGYDADGVIHFRLCGVGSNRDQTPSGNVVSNSQVYGGQSLVVMTAGAIGIVIRNNYFYNFTWSAIRCGNGVSETMSCTLNLFSNNYAFTSPNKPAGDSPAFYMTNKWFGPGNVYHCNYAFGGDHCYYLDFVSSGVTIDGGVCANTGTGIKWNTGKFNKVRSLIMHNQRGTISLFSCIAANFNCKNGSGGYWESRRSNYYSTPNTLKDYPYMQSICAGGVGPAALGGVPCNITSNATEGTCAPLPYKNDAHFWHVDAVNGQTPRDWCYNAHLYNNLNRINRTLVKSATAGFNDIANADYGIKDPATSSIMQADPTFRSCPKKDTGRQFVDPEVYWSRWNVPRPDLLSQVITAKWYFGGSY